MGLILAGLVARRPSAVRAINPGPSPQLIDTGGLNAASSVNDELLWAIASGAHPRRDRVGGTDGQAEGSAGLATDASGFAALRSPGWGGSGWYWPAPTIDTLEWTVGVRLAIASPGPDEQPSGDQAKVLVIPYHGATWGLPFGWSLWLGPFDAGAPVAQLRIGYAVDGSTFRSSHGPSDLVLLDGAEHSYVARVREEGTNGEVDWWRDGVLVATTSFNGAHAQADLGDAPYLMALNRHRQAHDDGEGPAATLPAAAIWGKALSDAQIELWLANPWDLTEVSADPPVPPVLRAWDVYVTAPVGEVTRIDPLANASGQNLSIQSFDQPTSVHAGTEVTAAEDDTKLDLDIHADETTESFDFSFTLTNGLNTSVASVFVAVGVLPPLGEDDNFTLEPGDTHTVSPLVNDNAPPGSIIIDLTQPVGVQAGTSVAIAANGTDLEITIDPNEEGEFSFDYTGKAPDTTQWQNTVTATVQEASPPIPGENPNQPFFGRWYGSGAYGAQDGVGNNSMSKTYNWYFFWGEKSGVIDRFITDQRYNNSSVYSSGNWGNYDIMIVEANPNTKSPIFPLNIYSRRNNYAPATFMGLNPSTAEGSRRVELTFPIIVKPTQAKGAYCLLWQNKGGGHISVNCDHGLSYKNVSGPPYAPPEEFHFPARIHLPGGIVRAWYPLPVVARESISYGRVATPMIQFRYADGTWAGWGNWGSGANDVYTILLSGNNQLRDRFMVTRGTRVVDRLCIYPYRERNLSPSGNLIATIEQGPSNDFNGNGTVLAQLSVATSSIYQLEYSTGIRPRKTESVNGADDVDKVPPLELVLGSPITLLDGQIYNVRLRATGSRVCYRVRNGPEAMNLSPKADSWAEHIAGRRVPWCAGEDSQGAHQTSNGGSSWSYITGSRRRMGYLFRCVIS